MSRIKVSNEVEVHEVNGKEVTPKDKHPAMVLKSHWNRPKLVVIEFPGSVAKYTFSAGDLRNAIQNATNTEWP